MSRPKQSPRVSEQMSDYMSNDPSFIEKVSELSRSMIKNDGTPNLTEIASSLGGHRRTVKRALDKLQDFDPSILEAAAAGGIEDPKNLSHFWKLVKDKDGNGYSLFVKNPSTGRETSVWDMVRDAVSQEPIKKITLPKRPPALIKGRKESLLVIDLADVHFLKLSVKTQTGYEYNREVAHHRVVEGTKALLAKSALQGINRVLFVMGNDILHVDNTRSTTTNGTYQDVDGTIYQGFRDASLALEEAISEASMYADVDLIHCMSNHDKVIGWALTQSVAGRLRNNRRIRATPYNISEAHRKYYRFESNLMGFTHGDGAKEEKLVGLLLKEAREHISDCPNLYWYLHHEHHKKKKVHGEVTYMREKDHTSMTAMVSGNPNIKGESINIEYVRSPSDPDGWHDQFGFVNKQAVECFIHHPWQGQTARFTEWF
jgi:hypothetical protein